MSDDRPKVSSLFDKSGSDKSANESDGDDGDEKRTRLYVGGSSKSGQQVLGPPKRNDRGAFIDYFFEQASKHGGRFVAVTEKRQTAGTGFRPFSGAGHSLKEVEDGPAKPAPNSNARARSVQLQMWSDCFTVDGGQPRPYSDPNNRSFLSRVMTGRVPAELLSADGEEEVVMQIENNSTQPYPRDKRNAASAVPFSGRGHLLGSPVPHVIGAGKVGEKYNPNAPAAVPLPESCNVDDSKPTTDVQVRTADGARLTLRVNLHHTISDLRLMICNKKPELQSQSFVLLYGFPVKQLDDESLTVEQAALQNTLLIVRTEQL